MPRMEIKDLSKTARIGHTAAEQIAVLIPRTKDQIVGLRHEKRLAVKLFYKLEMRGDTLGDRVRGHQIPQHTALLAPPGQIPRGADDAAKGLGLVC